MTVIKKQYKALMLDLDGTTIPNHRDGMPSQKVKDAIKKASALVYVGVATSRPVPHAIHLIKELNITSPCIVDGGAIVFDPVNDKVLREVSIDSKDYAYIHETIKSLGYQFLVNDGVKEYTNKDNYIGKANDIFIGDLSLEDVNKLMRTFSSLKTIALQKLVSWYKNRYDLKITHVSATKQHGIFEVAKILKIEVHEIIGVGEGYNDFPLLMACGLKVAMGNAVPDLKAIADYIAPTVEEDGVADVIEKFVLNR